jgi:hypothetical protein
MMRKKTFSESVGEWEQLLLAFPNPPRRTTVREREKTAGTRLQTDSDGRSEDRLNDQGVATV